MSSQVDKRGSSPLASPPIGLPRRLANRFAPLSLRFRRILTLQQVESLPVRSTDLSLKPLLEQVLASKDLEGLRVLLDAALDEGAVIDAVLTLNTSAVVEQLFSPSGAVVKPAVGTALGAALTKILAAALPLLRAVASYEGTLIQRYPRLESPELRKSVDEDRLAWVVDDDMPPEIGRIFIERFSGLTAALVVNAVATQGAKLLRWQAKELVSRLEQAQISQLKLLAALPGIRGQLQDGLSGAVDPLDLDDIYARHEEYRLGLSVVHAKAQQAFAQGSTVFHPFGEPQSDDEDA